MHVHLLGSAAALVLLGSVLSSQSEPNGHVMVVIKGGEFVMGSLSMDPDNVGFRIARTIQ